MNEVRFALSGEVDVATAPKLCIDLRDAVGDGADLVVDCAGLTFIDSSGIRTLWETHDDLEARGHRLTLTNLTGMPRLSVEVLGLCGLLRVDDQPST